jgi:type IV pilus assembly protein PilV
MKLGTCQQQRGFGLIEVLIAFAILTAALMGMMRLQAASLQLNTGAYYQSQATLLAQDMFERIRANPDAGYEIALADGVPSSSNCQSIGANCSSDDMADFDLAYWKCSLGARSSNSTCTSRNIVGLLPNGDGSIEVTDNDYTMTIRWFDPASNTEQSFVFDATI